MGSSKSRSKDTTHLGLLVLRLGIGVILVCMSYPQLLAGKEAWRSMGQSAMEPVGVTFGYWVWGLLGIVSMLAGGAFIAIGVAFRPSAVCLLVTTGLVAFMRYHEGQSLAPGQITSAGLIGAGYGPALAAAVVFLALLIGGSGEYAIGRAFRPLHGKWYQ